MYHRSKAAVGQVITLKVQAGPSLVLADTRVLTGTTGDNRVPGTVKVSTCDLDNN